MERAVAGARPEVLREARALTRSGPAWTASSAGTESWPDTADPLKALDAILARHGAGLLPHEGPHGLPRHGPRSCGGCGTRTGRSRAKGGFLVLVSPRLVVPGRPEEGDLRPRLRPARTRAEILFLLGHLGKRYFGEKGLAGGGREEARHGAQGAHAGRDRARRARRSSPAGPVFDEAAYFEVLAEKEQATRKDGVLEFVPPRFSLADIGGLENLKEWLVKRKKLFTKEALDAGMPVPKGILMMGMSGCGKSLSVKAISALWNLPLFRLDMNLVFGHGQPGADVPARPADGGVAVAGAPVDRRDRDGDHGRPRGGRRRRLARAHLLDVPDLDAGEAGARLRRGHGEPHPPPARPRSSARAASTRCSSSTCRTRTSASPSSTSTSRRSAPTRASSTSSSSRRRRRASWASEIEAAVQAAAVEAYNQGRKLNEDDLSKMHHGHGAALEDDGRADQGHQELGARPRDAGLQGLT